MDARKAQPSANRSPKITTLPPTLEIALREMNDEFCFVERIPGIVVIPTQSDPEPHVYSRGEFTQSLCSNRFAEHKNVATEWMKWKDRRTVKSLTYAPGKPRYYDGFLNVWLPSQIQPIKGDLTLWFAYLDHIFQSDSTHRDWFLAWLAYQFQHPGTKLHSAVVFWSPETGTGKSFFGYLMAELFGTHNFAEINEGELHGRFNFWAARKQFVMGEEIKGSNAQKHNDYLKSVITRKFVTIDTKNTPHYTLPDCINYFFTSNRDNAFALDSTDRRFFVHRLGDKKLEADYVEKTLKPWLNNGGYAAVLHYLMHEVDLTAPLSSTNAPFNPFGAAPQTAARKDMIEAGRDEAEVWLESLIADDSLVFRSTGWKLASAEDLFNAYTKCFPRTRVAYKTFAGFVKKTYPAVRGGNLIPLGDNVTPKKLYCPPCAFRTYDGVSVESLISSYSIGREE